MASRAATAKKATMLFRNSLLILGAAAIIAVIIAIGLGVEYLRYKLFVTALGGPHLSFWRWFLVFGGRHG